MAKEYTKEELWKLYKKLPEELKETVFSETTANNIFNICARNGIEDDRTSKIARFVGHVLIGLLPPDEFQETLEKELRLEVDPAKKVAREIFRFIFYPVKTILEEVYKKEIAPPASPSAISPTAKSSGEAPPTGTIQEEKSEEEKKDIYREPIE